MRNTLLAVLLLVCAMPATARPEGRAIPPASTTAAATSLTSWSFAVLGDSRDDPDGVFPAIVDRIHADGSLAFVVHLGDMTHSGGESQLKGFLDASAPIRECFFPVIGNHELGRDKDRHAFKAAFGLKGTAYSFTYRDVHFVILDDASQEFSPDTLNWLRSDLEQHRKGTRGVERVFVAMHIPPAVPGLKLHVEGDKMQRFESGSRHLLELLREYSTDVVFAGHEHRVQVVDVPGGPRVVISGAAGAPQGWRRTPEYGYHRVTVTGDVRIEFVEVKSGNVPNVSAPSVPRACPEVAEWQQN